MLNRFWESSRSRELRVAGWTAESSSPCPLHSYLDPMQAPHSPEMPTPSWLSRSFQLNADRRTDKTILNIHLYNRNFTFLSMYCMYICMYAWNITLPLYSDVRKQYVYISVSMYVCWVNMYMYVYTYGFSPPDSPLIRTDWFFPFVLSCWKAVAAEMNTCGYNVGESLLQLTWALFIWTKHHMYMLMYVCMHVCICGDKMVTSAMLYMSSFSKGLTATKIEPTWV